MQDKLGDEKVAKVSDADIGSSKVFSVLDTDNALYAFRQLRIRVPLFADQASWWFAYSSLSLVGSPRLRCYGQDWKARRQFFCL